MTDLPEPPDTLSDPRELLVGYLDFYRSTVLRKLDGLPEEDLHRSILPSGWTPLELLKHLAYVERRWFRWGFAAEEIEQPWGDRDPTGKRWKVGEDESAEQVKELFLDECARTRAIVAASQLTDIAGGGGRFDSPDRPPALSWIMFHVLQEYARHTGHLDVVRELMDGRVGE